MENEKHTITAPGGFPANYLEHATGPIAIRMTNDYMFKAILQSNNKVLKGLISALLHIPIEEIQSVKIRNPIVLGKTIDEKDFYLDILVELNNNVLINLEMQVLNEHDWPERSLSYLCRTFDHLTKGAFYTDVKPVIHIGILDFTLFPEYPEFFSTYKFMNIKNHLIYSDKLSLSVLDLKHIDLATDEDKHFETDHWARLFKSTTWEEIKMLAMDNEYIQEASNTAYQLSQEESVYWQCLAREDYYRRQAKLERLVATESKLADVEGKLANAEDKLADTEGKLANAEDKLANAEGKLANAEDKLADAEGKLANAEDKLADTEGKLADTEDKLADTESKLADEKNRADTAEKKIAALQAELARLQAQQKQTQ